jgi:hypothetical protein
VAEGTRHGLQLAQPIAGLNHVIAYGQSLSNGWEGWPALSLTPRGDSLMLGRSVRPLSESAPQWVPVGGPTLSPLVGTVQDLATGEVLSEAGVASLPAGSLALGETVLEGALNAYRGFMPAEMRAARLLASACGVGGRTLEDLSRGASPNLFGRLVDCATLAHRVASEQGQAYQVLAMLLLQGENNAWALNGGTADRATYRSLMARLYQDVVRALAMGIARQPTPPALFTYQTGGAYASDELGVAMAQLDVALALPGCFMVGPVYPVTDKGGHLDANGYRWLGAQFGKVMHRVLTLGESWRPLHPVATALRDREARVRFAVPVPPLAWGRPFCGARLVEVADLGFTVTDAAGLVPIESVTLAGPDEVALTLARLPQPPIALRYADLRHAGLGALHDSDATLAEDAFALDPFAGGGAEADVRGLVGRPYKLQNWCVAFNVPLLGRR